MGKQHSDTDLMRLFQAGSESAFEALIERHEARIFGLLYHLVKRYDKQVPSQDIEALTWNVFFKVYESAASFGSPFLRFAGVKNPAGLVAKLQGDAHPLSLYIRERLSKDTQRQLIGYDGHGSPTEELQRALIEELNQLIQRCRFDQVPGVAPLQMPDQVSHNPTVEAKMQLNRLVLETVYPDEIARSQNFAGWISQIARYTAIDYLREKGSQQELLLESDEALFDTIAQVADLSASPETMLSEQEQSGVEAVQEAFYFQALKEVLVTQHSRVEEIHIGEIQYEAFNFYYFHGLTQKEVLARITPRTEVYDKEVGLNDSNNWLSGGRLLRKLCDYLIDTYLNLFDPQSLKALIDLSSLGPDERRFVESVWLAGKSCELLALEENRPVSELQRILKLAIKKVKETHYHQVKSEISRKS